jgi:hypothetical protein
MCLELESITVKQLFSPVVIKSETNCGLCKSVASEVVKSRERCKICNPKYFGGRCHFLTHFEIFNCQL